LFGHDRWTAHAHAVERVGLDGFWLVGVFWLQQVPQQVAVKWICGFVYLFICLFVYLWI
jgi:hypothetical protein